LRAKSSFVAGGVAAREARDTYSCRSRSPYKGPGPAKKQRRRLSGAGSAGRALCTGDAQPHKTGQWREGRQGGHAHDFPPDAAGATAQGAHRFASSVAGELRHARRPIMPACQRRDEHKVQHGGSLFPRNTWRLGETTTRPTPCSSPSFPTPPSSGWAPRCAGMAALACRPCTCAGLRPAIPRWHRAGVWTPPPARRLCSSAAACPVARGGRGVRVRLRVCARMRTRAPPTAARVAGPGGGGPALELVHVWRRHRLQRHALRDRRLDQRLVLRQRLQL